MKKTQPELISLLKEWRGSRSQAHAAKDLGVSQGLWSAWENGDRPISIENLIKLGNVLDYPASHHFWSAAGIPTEKLMQINGFIPKIQGKRKVASQREMASIQMLEGEICAGSGLFLSDVPKEDTAIMLPREFVPHPENTKCVRVRGDSMAPTISDHSIIGIDSSYLGFAQLVGVIVAAQRPGDGAIVRRLSKFGDVLMLTPDNPAYSPIPYTGESWKIVGQVIFWIGQLQPRK